MSDEDREDDQQALGDDWEAALAEQQGDDGVDDEPSPSDSAPADADTDTDTDTAQRASLDDLEPSGEGPEDEDVNLDVILDIPVTLSMEIGRTKISIRNLLQLNQGSVVELDRLAGEPMDVMVNGTLVAHGEVVVVNERFGIRLTDVVSPSERVRKLK
ncbi:flagellar motor switch protein FliN [Arhodomonas sp. AD133]|uniref:flagellar motor switch protein FliN n=1 Tax=Arhodomonas sp. AD133 TaxID=3415009 RepID=UPI003EBC5FC8